MAERRPFGAAGAALVVLLVTSPAASDAGQDSKLVVHLDDHVRLPAKDLGAVKRNVDDIFRAADVAVSWAGPLRRPVSESSCDGLRHVAVAIINIQTPFSGAASDTADVLGRAAPAYSRAWVFYNRVAQFASDRPVDINLLLARAVAHEIGHLLLPPEAPHGTVGIMRPSLELGHLGFLRFSRDESKLIRAALAGPRAARVPC